MTVPASTPWVLPCIASTEPDFQIGPGSSNLGGHCFGLAFARPAAVVAHAACGTGSSVIKIAIPPARSRLDGGVASKLASSSRRHPLSLGTRLDTSHPAGHQVTDTDNNFCPSSPWASCPRSATSGTPSISVATSSMFGYVQQCPLLSLPPSASSGHHPPPSFQPIGRPGPRRRRGPGGRTVTDSHS